MSSDIRAAYLEETLRGMRGHKHLAEGAFEQLRDHEFFEQLDGEANSVAILIKHISGNLRSRFRDFLISDGEKPDRHRDQEFILDPRPSRAELLRWWEEGWRYCFDAIGGLKPEDVDRTVTIREQPHTIVQALNRSFGHMAYHVGQIVLLAKHIRGNEWKNLSVPRGKSEEFNAEMTRRWKEKSSAQSGFNPVLSEHVGAKK